MLGLVNKRIVVTRPHLQAITFAYLLHQGGAVPILFPTIQISPVLDSSTLDYALQNLASYQWLVFTSIHGVKSVFERFQVLDIQLLPPNIQIAAIGPKTAQDLADRGCPPDFIPQEYILEEIVPGLGDLKGKQILLARSDLARKILPEMIRAKGGLVDDLVAYHTLPSSPDLAGLEEIQRGVDMVTFASPSAIENFIHIISRAGLSISELPGRPHFAYIGPVSAKRGVESNLPQDVVAEEYTIEGLMTAIVDHYQSEEIYTNA